ncbi:hypothetical protein SUDANB105_01707 [Streptomyces sp. enrichment culture]|uniref:hypothetical protein n=1 Tax=Streptomyces sp. enrichment culture TaxID=1795815 RepID=UPI003F569223
MFRGATARAGLAALAAVLFLFPCLVVATSFAHAYASRNPVAITPAGIPPSVTARTTEDHNLHRAPFCGDPTGLPHHRDRTRPSTPAPDTTGRPLPVRGTPGTGLAAPPPGAAYDEARSPTAHSPAALQVFRC